MTSARFKLYKLVDVKKELTGRRESSGSSFRARSFKSDVLSLSSESERRDISGSNLLIRETASENRCLVPSPVSVPLKIPPSRPPKDATAAGGRRRAGRHLAARRWMPRRNNAATRSGLGKRLLPESSVPSVLATGTERSREAAAICSRWNPIGSKSHFSFLLFAFFSLLRRTTGGWLLLSVVALSQPQQSVRGGSEEEDKIS